MRKKVSCHIITYNQIDYISKCIDGVLMQETNFPIEIIIGDDNSTDGTRELLLDYSNKYPDIIKLNLREVRGLGLPGKQNFMTTLEMCTGEYISLCDGDDYWTDPLKLQKQIDFLDSNPDYVLCFHPIDILNTDGTIVEDFITKVPENYETIETLARLGNYIHTPSVVYRNVLPTLPFEFKITPIGDYFLYMMLAEHGKLKYINDKMAVYRFDVGILSGNNHVLKLKKWIDCLILIFSNCKNEEIKKIIYERYDTCLQELYRMTLKVENESNFSMLKKKLKSLKNKIYKKK
ncbi:glycosyltransferase [Flavobacterium sp.]|uniref:glycosyltransferase family 2 protein n=1 Tax=Flavobacterium sp. TaxID=239 RepID=UPI003266F370